MDKWAVDAYSRAVDTHSGAVDIEQGGGHLQLEPKRKTQDLVTLQPKL